MARVALVTGANQGIGLEIVRELCKKFDGTVILAARHLQRGEEAKKTLEGEGLRPSFLQLDVDSKESIQVASDSVREKYGRLDVLINNAAVLLRTDCGLSFHERAIQSIKTNYHGVLHVTQAFAPLLQPNSRIVNMSSGYGSSLALGKTRREQVTDPNLTIQGLTNIMDEFVRATRTMEEYDGKEWVDPSGDYAAYRMSKIGVCRLTELFLDTIGKDPTRHGMLINSVCPGWVKTKLGTFKATRSTEQGAETPVYLALLPPGTTEPNGLFLRDKTPVRWK